MIILKVLVTQQFFCVVRCTQVRMEMYQEKIESLEVIPVIEGKPVPGGEVVGDMLSMISLKDPSQDSDPDRVVKRNSFRDLLRPNVASLEWASQNASVDKVYSIVTNDFRIERLHAYSKFDTAMQWYCGSAIQSKLQI